ncbi:L-ascorbate oxidase homolog [Olea europaea subsp. europaea]|uniref:L-ascorbate oxidase homolog n=1 Tax=Olea europaea subsp. europaea TaxID=158383 RepID=A0A8S0R0B9_OLEEU|nr:L-ascorbate oxidase homolog [Olea europaea subsp. europaea]
MTFVSLFLYLSAGALAVHAENSNHFFEWNVTYGTIAPLGVPQQGILINGQFPGPRIKCTSNNNIVVNVFNNLDEPFLLTWNGVRHRKYSWQDGTLGTMRPILPDEYFLLLGDWYNKGHKSLNKQLGSRRYIGRPDGIHINGKSGKVDDKATKPLYTMESSKTYRDRVYYVGMKTSVNFRLQGLTLKLSEMEGSHTVQNIYDSLDLHVGQCLSVLVAANQVRKDYYFVVSSSSAHSGGTEQSLVSAARPNPKGSYHYSQINITHAIKLVNSRSYVDGKLRFVLNGVSHVDSETPLKLAEYFGASDKLFKYDISKDEPRQDNTMAQYQVYPNSWAAVMTTLDNAGMWSLRSEMLERVYLGQQLYFSVLSPALFLRDEYNLPDNAPLWGIVRGLPMPFLTLLERNVVCLTVLLQDYKMSLDAELMIHLTKEE